MTSDDFGAVRSIVLIDDDADFLHVMQRRLQAQRSEYATTEPVVIHTFTDPVEALVNMPAEGICVAIVDYNMPGGTGLDWLPKLIAAGVGPVILLSNQNQVNVATEAFRAGAADYIAKADAMADDKRLGRAIRVAVQRFRLETSNRTLTRQLKLVNVELEAKNKRLKELTETAHQFVDDVAHDFRTPLTVIQQYASIVADGLSGPVTDRQCDHLSVIAEATRELSEMVDDFLDSSKLRSRTLCIDRQCHTVPELLESIGPMLAVRAKPRQISVETVVAEDVAPFFADLPKTIRVLTNLAVNAMKVTPEGHPLRLWARPTETGDVRIGVTDEGPGMPPEDLTIIFERFKQLQEPQLAGAKGFGLGLSIVKQLTWLNLGKIEVQSELGKGSTFAFTLPANVPQRILACFVENIRLLEEPGDLRMFRISSRGGTPDVSTLRRQISTFCYPMDLVLQDADGDAVNVAAVCGDVDQWIGRLREQSARFYRSVGHQGSELDIKMIGSWSRDTDNATLQTALLECLNGRTCNA
jgi:signal transduction histidine kinase